MTSKRRAEIQTLIDAHVKGFNAKDNDLFLSVFGDTAIIIDGISPSRWLNPKCSSQLARCRAHPHLLDERRTMTAC